MKQKIHFPKAFHFPRIFRRDSKNKSALQSNAAILPSNHVLFLQPDSSCHLLKKTCCLPIIVAILFTNLCATVIVGTSAARLNVSKSVLRRVYRFATRGDARYATKIFRTFFAFTVHRSRENLQNPVTFTYIIILVALSRVAYR